MRIETIAVGTPRVVPWRGRDVRTSIFKSPVEGPVRVVRHNVEGDRQADRRVHGGEFKAVYAYAAEHYDWWRSSLGRELEPANFGENLTIRDFDEGAVSIGDVFRMGGAELEAVAPRLPCSKLGLRFGDPGMVKEFALAGRWGIYFRVEKEGSLTRGDPVERIHTDPARLPVYELARVFLSDRNDGATIERLVRHDRVDPETRQQLREKLRSLTAPAADR
jgi:MOSC domain-containing protein YiiM